MGVIHPKFSMTKNSEKEKADRLQQICSLADRYSFPQVQVKARTVLLKAGQKAGRVLKMFGVCPGPVMGSAPASPVWASVMAVFGGCSEDRSAQVAASADCATKTRIGSFITHILTSSPLDY